MTSQTLEINGEKYVRLGADFSAQTERVLDCLGETMLTALQEAGAIIAGGAILSAFTHAEVNDIDVYFPSLSDMHKAFIKVTEEWDSVYLGHTDKSITLQDRDTGMLVQFIYFDYFQDGREVFSAFDFTVCMAAIELKGSQPELVYNPRFLSDVASRTLHFNQGTRFPYISLVRTRKYIEKGFKIGKGSLLTIGVACSNYPITNWEEAKEQLGGVYGNAIDLRVEEGKEFSHENMLEAIQEVSNNKSIMTRNYEEIRRKLEYTDSEDL